MEGRPQVGPPGLCGDQGPPGSLWLPSRRDGALSPLTPCLSAAAGRVPGVPRHLRSSVVTTSRVLGRVLDGVTACPGSSALQSCSVDMGSAPHRGAGVQRGDLFCQWVCPPYWCMWGWPWEVSKGLPQEPGRGPLPQAGPVSSIHSGAPSRRLGELRPCSLAGSVGCWPN